MTVFGKTNRLARKSIIAYVRKWSFEHEGTNGNKEKEARLTRRRSLASNLDDAIFVDVKGKKAIKKIFFSR